MHDEALRQHLTYIVTEICTLTYCEDSLASICCKREYLAGLESVPNPDPFLNLQPQLIIDNTTIFVHDVSLTTY